MNRLVLLATVATLALTRAVFAQTTPNASLTTPPKATAQTKPPQTQSPQATSPMTQSNSHAAQTKTETVPMKNTSAAHGTALRKNGELAPEKSVHPAKTGLLINRERQVMMHAALGARRREARLADRETRALNVLETRGYGNFDGLKRDSRDFTAIVMSHGKPMKVLINPDTGTVTQHS